MHDTLNGSDLQALSSAEAAELHQSDLSHARRHAPARTAQVSPGSVSLRHAPLPPHCEIALGERFAERHEDELRFEAATNCWLTYDGTRWRRDRTRLAPEWARRVAREAAQEAKDGASGTIATARTRAAILSLASSDRRIAATDDQWDVDPWQLNTPRGTIDLRTGELGPHCADDYLTKITAVPPDPACAIPIWMRFLESTFRTPEGKVDVELIAYLTRALGYALTGITKEHAMWYLHGTGANGKSVLLATVAGIMGDYHRTSPIETFTASPVDRHPTELANLRGARLVTAIETEEGRQWAEARIKTLTGADTIAARYMRQDFFEFVPQFKLFVAGNHAPTLKSVDEAIRRRFNLVPFSTTIPEGARDPELANKLRAEWPGILAWLIKGCAAWHSGGLRTPGVVASATAAYLTGEDAIGSWLDECCVVGRKHSDNSGTLFNSWKAWAERAGEAPGSRQRFSKTIDGRGFEPQRTMHERRYRGLMVRTSAGSARPIDYDAG